MDIYLLDNLPYFNPQQNSRLKWGRNNFLRYIAFQRRVIHNWKNFWTSKFMHLQTDRNLSIQALYLVSPTKDKKRFDQLKLTEKE